MVLGLGKCLLDLAFTDFKINDGPCHRWINETLYKSDSKDAVQMMSSDPKVYEEVCASTLHPACGIALT